MSLLFLIRNQELKMRSVECGVNLHFRHIRLFEFKFNFYVCPRRCLMRANGYLSDNGGMIIANMPRAFASGGTPPSVAFMPTKRGLLSDNKRLHTTNICRGMFRLCEGVSLYFCPETKVPKILHSKRGDGSVWTSLSPFCRILTC